MGGALLSGLLAMKMQKKITVVGTSLFGGMAVAKVGLGRIIALYYLLIHCT